MIRTYNSLTAALRRQNRKQYLLLFLCCFVSVLLITAFVSIMRSPTVLSVLPEGGDSRKQVMMIFILSVVGCGVFTAYAAGLFLRYKGRELGVLLALGASKRQVGRKLLGEMGALSVLSCLAGMALGVPLACGIWQGFRLLVVDTEEMALTLRPQAALFALVFSASVTAMLLWMAWRALRRTNIMEIISEARRSEPIREVKRWYGPAGILLMVSGMVLGYMAPGFFLEVLHYFPPEAVLSLFYLPLFPGLYMVLLHTVVNGWGQKKNRYQNIIANSMMKFQGRQTVRNMLVITVLIAGGYFGLFYIPTISAQNTLSTKLQPADYAYHYRADQDIPEEPEIRALAEEMRVTVTSFRTADLARLTIDGTTELETETPFGITLEVVYMEELRTDLFLSESACRALTGEAVSVAPGKVLPAASQEDGYTNISRVTNPFTGAVLTVEPEGILENSLLAGRYILSDTDYAALTAGLPTEWRERQIFFDVENVSETYPFAKALFNAIVDRSSQSVAVIDGWDPVIRERCIAEKGYYYADPDYCEANGLGNVDYAQRESSAFRLYWQYMPHFRVLDQNDFTKTVAVFLMLFAFVAIVCFAAVLVIAYTRCVTIALNSRQVYDDLRRLGASPRYLYQSVRRQVGRVFAVPALVGTLAICALYAFILYFNGSPPGFTPSELAGYSANLAVVAIGSAILYAVYRATLRTVLRSLRIQPQRRGRARGIQRTI